MGERDALSRRRRRLRSSRGRCCAAGGGARPGPAAPRPDTWCRRRHRRTGGLRAAGPGSGKTSEAAPEHPRQVWGWGRGLPPGAAALGGRGPWGGAEVVGKVAAV